MWVPWLVMGFREKFAAWSALNVPLLWAAAADDRLCPMILWLREVSQSLPMVSVAGVQMAGPDAVMTGWESLRDVMRSIEIRSRTVRRKDPQRRFPHAKWEVTSAQGCKNVAWVSALESVFVSVTLGECGQTREPVATVPRPVTPHTSGSFSDSCWETLDRVNLREVFESRFPVLQNCLHSVRLEARPEAVRSQDVIGEARGWKLFCLLPFRLLSPDSHRVPKLELCRRMDMFSQGAWEELMHEAFALVSNERCLSPSGDSDQRRAEAACHKAQLGEVSRARQCLTGASLAPGTEATFREMQSRRPQEVQRPIPCHATCRRSQDVLEKSEESATRCFPRAWGLHLRGPENLVGRPRYFRVVVRGRKEPCPSVSHS